MTRGRSHIFSGPVSIVYERREEAGLVVTPVTPALRSVEAGGLL